MDNSVQNNRRGLSCILSKYNYDLQTHIFHRSVLYRSKIGGVRTQEATVISLKLLLNLNVQGAPKTFPLKLGPSFKPGFRPKLIRSFGLILDFVFRLRFGFRLTRLIPKTKLTADCVAVCVACLCVKRRDDQQLIHPCIIQFDKLTASEKQYNLSLAQEMLRYMAFSTWMLIYNNLIIIIIIQ